MTRKIPKNKHNAIKPTRRSRPDEKTNNNNGTDSAYQTHSPGIGMSKATKIPNITAKQAVTKVPEGERNVLSMSDRAISLANHEADEAAGDVNNFDDLLPFQKFLDVLLSLRAIARIYIGQCG